MKEDRLNELLERCESPIERELLIQLYPHLTTDRALELCAQYQIDYYDDMSVTRPDFAFPDMQIAIYCDGFAWRQGNWVKFCRDRLQSRELQLREWIVLRFAGSEINRDSEMVVDTVQRAIALRNQQQTPLVLREENSLQVSIQEWQNEKEQAISARQPRQDQQKPQTLELHSGRTPLDLHFGQAQQKPKGGMCGVIFLAFVIVGIVVLLNFIF